VYLNRKEQLPPSCHGTVPLCQIFTCVWQITVTVLTFFAPCDVTQVGRPLVFTAHQKAVCKRCICYGISVRPSVRLPVRPSHSGIGSKRGNAEGCGLYHQVSRCLVFWCQEWLLEEYPVQVKFECKEVDPCEISRTVRISSHNSGTIINSENSSLNAIESRP